MRNIAAVHVHVNMYIYLVFVCCMWNDAKSVENPWLKKFCHEAFGTFIRLHILRTYSYDNIIEMC